MLRTLLAWLSFFLFIHTPVMASQFETDAIAKLSAISLYNIDKQALKGNLKAYMYTNEGIRALKVIEALSGETYIELQKNDSDVIIDAPLPQNLVGFDFYQADVMYNTEKVGKVFAYYNVKNSLLTAQERKYLENNDVINIGTLDYWAPYNFYEFGQPKGYSIELMNLVAQKVGMKINYFPSSSLQALLSKAKKGEIHAVLGIAQTEEREDFLSFSDIYTNVQNAIMIHKDSISIRTIEDLKGKTLAVTKGLYYVEYLKKKYPEINLHLVESELASLKAVSEKRADATIGSMYTMQYSILKNDILHLKHIALNSEGTMNSIPLRIGIQKEAPLLLSIIQKGLATINEDELKTIKEHWLSTLKENNILDFSNEETKWLSQHKKIRYAVDPNWLPVERINEQTGKHEGMIAEIISQISQVSGLEFELVPTKNFSETNTLLKEGKVDMVAAISKTSEREQFLSFSEPLLSLSNIVLMRSTEKDLQSLNDLAGKQVGVNEGTMLHKMLQTNCPEIIAVPIKGVPLALEKLSKGEIDAYLGSLEVIGYQINALGLFNLRTVLKLEEKRIIYSAFQKSLPSEVLSIYNKALKTLSDEEIEHIRSSWIGVQTKVNYTLIWQLALGAFLIGLILFYFNYQLKKRVKEKTAELNALLASFNTYVISSKTDLKGIITHVSDAFCAISGYTREELIGKSHNIVRHPDTPKSVFENLWKTLKEGNVWKGEIKNLTKQGGYYWVDAIIALDYDSKGKHIGYNAIRQDITAAKEVEELKENLEIKIVERTQELNDERNFVDAVMNSQSTIVISTNGKTIISANKSFLEFYSVSSIDEFHTTYGNCICDTFDKNAGSEYIQKFMGEEMWIDYIYARPQTLHKTIIIQEGEKHTFTITADAFTFSGQTLKTAVFTDITELESIQKNVELILSNILLPVLITSKKERKIIYANKYAEIQYEKSLNELLGTSIDCVYTIQGQHKHIIEILERDGRVENAEEIFKTSSGREFSALLSVTPILYQEEEAYIGMVTDITKQKEMEKEIRAIHRHTTESIEYASLIQHALIPSNDLFRKYFSDYLTIWQPKDIVGGDLYLFEELRNEDECLLTVIDCTGHGVPGAFVTMLVKAIERQITGTIINSDEIVSPAKILSIFNQSMKHLLKQESEDSISNAGFDGAILYYNKRDKVVKFSGAGIGLFVIKENILETIKGDRHSIGYKKSDANFEFTDHIIEAKEGMQFYITTDGYLDQNGGEKGFPFGKKRFAQLLQNNAHLPFADQQEVLLYEMLKYRKDEEKNDDVTIIGVKI